MANIVDKIYKALIGRSRSDYERLRAKIIKDKGYDYFRRMQQKAIRKISYKKY